METEYVHSLLAEIPMETLSNYQKEYLHRLADSVTAAVMGTPYSPPSTAGHSDDTTSPVYPDRPIRPLPKRPLRSRLSPEVAETILYPPAPPSNNSMFYGSYVDAPSQEVRASTGQSVGDMDKALIEAQGSCNGNTQPSYQFKGNEDDSEDDEGSGLRRRYYEEYQQRQSLSATSARGISNGASRAQEAPSHSTVSSNDSVDGYDSFENTNNKKKRKIPTSGAFGSLHTSLSAELANMGISHSRDPDSTPTPEDRAGPYYRSGSAAAAIPVPGTGISGAGRGRYGRSGRRDTSGRSPLGVSLNGTNATQTSRFAGQRREQALSDTGKAPGPPTDHGIISAAIAEAAALPTTPSKGQENVSLLEQQSVKKSTPKTQFTFELDSKGMVWPGDNSLPGPAYAAPPPVASAPPPSQYQKGFSTQGTQTSPTMAGQQTQNGVPPASAGQQSQQQPRKPRRPPGKRYAIAARERRLQQEYNNYHHPPREEDIWICEFCEYESIFGGPPEALVRQYEIKDRRERKRLAEKRRLLEKAKMKGRKGKKGSKNAAKNSVAAAHAQQSAGQQNHHTPPSATVAVQSHGTQSDEYFGDDYDDDPTPAPPPQAPTKIPQPVAQNHAQSVRSAHPNGGLNARDGGAIRTA